MPAPTVQWSLPAPTPPLEVEAEMVEVIDLVGRSSLSVRRSPHLSDIPNQPRVFDEKRLKEAWRKILDYSSKTNSGTFYSKYADNAV